MEKKFKKEVRRELKENGGETVFEREREKQLEGDRHRKEKDGEETGKKE